MTFSVQHILDVLEHILSCIHSYLLYNLYRRCYGIVICSNSQPFNPHHNTCSLELRSDIASDLSSGKTIFLYNMSLNSEAERQRLSNLSLRQFVFMSIAKTALSAGCASTASRVRYQGIVAGNMIWN